jgi:hypothetical protein
LRLKMTGPTREGQPSFVVRVYQVKPESSEGSAASSSCDMPWNGDTELTLVRETTQSNLAFS